MGKEESNEQNNFVGNNERKWCWIGCTLNPYYEGNCVSSMINDDRFILHTLKDNDIGSGWVFGWDSTGDIMCRKNLENIIGMYHTNGR